MVVRQYARACHGFVENLTADYVFFLGAYRALYLANWIYRYMTEERYLADTAVIIVWVAGAVQTFIYLDFMYYFVKRCSFSNCLESNSY